MNYEVIDNFLPELTHSYIKERMMSVDFPWFFNQHMTLMKKDNPFFSHNFYYNYTSCSHDFDSCVLPLVQILPVKGLIEVRANLMINKNVRYESDWHCDRFYPCKTAIYYVNDTNGYTVLDKEKQINIPCKENTMLVFDSDVLHKAVSQTDNERRIVINFNYFD